MGAHASEAARVHEETGEKPVRDPLPLVVEVEYGLVRTSLSVELASQILRDQPQLVFALATAWLMGEEAFEKVLVRYGRPERVALPLHQRFLAHLRREALLGREILLLSRGPTLMHPRLLEELDVHATIITEPAVAAERRLPATVSAIGHSLGPERPFAYAAGSRGRLWHVAASGVLLEVPRAAFLRILGRSPVSHVLAERPPWPRMLLVALRVHQWGKNLLVFVPLLLAHVFDMGRLSAAMLAFIAFSLVASSAYLLNDFIDAPKDRRHATKKQRPQAAGWLTPGPALGLSLILAVTGLTLAATLGAPFTVTLVSYLALTLAYSLWLRGVALLDTLLLAGLYMGRILAGGVATAVSVSPWLMAFAFFTFYSLALVKRAAELVGVNDAASGRVSGRAYDRHDLAVVSQLGIASGVVAVLVAALYLASAWVQTLYTRPLFLWPTCLGFFYWISRVWLLTMRGKMHADPVLFALTDRVSWLVLIWVLAFGYAAF